MIRISGPIPINIYPFFWLLALFIGWLNTFTIQGTAVWTVIIILSVLVHEYGHALTALAFGQKAHIDLMGLGGLTHRRGGKLKAWKEFLIVLNGPIAGFLLCGALWWGKNLLIVTHPNSTLVYMLTVGFYINLFWTVVNLIPIQPMDGGKLLSIILEGIFGLRGIKIALFISLVLAAILGVFFFAMQAFLAGALFLMFTYESYRAWKSSLALTEYDQDFVLQHLLKEAEAEFQNGFKEDALEKYQRICKQTHSGVIYLAATERIAQLLSDKGEFQAAYTTLESLRNKLSPEGMRLLQLLAYRLKLWQEAILIGDKAYQLGPHYNVALLNALCHSALGQVQPAIGWLRCAIREGIPNLKEALNQGEFDSIRQDPQFKLLQEQ